MIPGRHQPDPAEMKSLVAEQQGLFWSLLAIFLALFLGLAFRATFSPEKITALLREAAVKIHPDVDVQFETAYLSLSDGLFPELSVVIENVTASSQQTCWMQPLMKIDVIRLPLSVSELIHGRVELAKVDVGNADLTLRSERKDCPEAAATKTSSAQRKTSSKESEDENEEVLDVTVEKRNPVENVSIRSMQIRTPSERFGSFEIRRVRVRVNPNDRIVKADGGIILQLENLSGAAPTHADFNVEYRSLAPATVLATVQGFWREGRYHLQLESNLATQKTKASLDAQHLPLNQVLSLSQMSQEWNGKRAWLSFKVSTDGEQTIGPDTRLAVQDLKIEGDLGELESSSFQILKVDPWQASPFSVNLRGVRLEKLFAFLDLEAPSPALGDLGTFNGQLNVQGRQEFELVGEHSGLQFIFSNRGEREMQTLSVIAGKASFQKDHWNVEVNRIRPLDGLFLGRVNLQADRSWKKVQMNVGLDELSLSPAVQRLMTGGGSLGRWSGDFQLGMESGKIHDIKGQVQVAELLVENLGIDRGQVQMSTKNGEMKLDLSGKRVKLAAPSPLLDVIKPFLPNEGENFAEQIRLQMQSKDLNALKWKIFPTKVGQVTLHSEGEWDDQGVLRGEIARSEGREEKHWKITGTREAPRFESPETAP